MMEEKKQELIAYQLDGAGWAELRLHAQPQPFCCAVSYLHDSLGDLAKMALAMQKGATQSEAVFMNEPGEVTLVVTGAKDTLQYELREYSDWASWGIVAVDDHVVVARGEILRQELVRNIHRILQRMDIEVGAKRYRELWIEHDFPQRDYESLSIALHKRSQSSTQQ